jgi:hypothetical protein
MNIIRNRCSFFFSRALLLTACLIAACAPVSAQTFVTKDGGVIEVSLKPDKKVIMLGETTYLSYEVKNFSEHDLCMSVGGDYRNEFGRPDSFKVTVVRDDGKPVPQPEVKLSMGGLVGCARIPAHGSHVIKLFLPHWATFESTGTYSIRVERGLALTKYSAKDSTKFTSDVSTKIEIVPTDEKSLGEVIDSLGKVMLDPEHPESEQATAALNFIDDKRAIKFFVQALEKFSQAADHTREHDRIRPVASALSKFNDDDALAAIEKLMDSRNQETRRDIASALGRSKHPQAIELLLKMRTDNYWGVRLEIAFALGMIETSRSNSLLREMLEDESEYVRNAAKHYLEKRAQK